MVNYRTFQLSDDLFWGFSIKLDLDEIESIEEVFVLMKVRLKNFLKKGNLEILVEKLDKKVFHCSTLGKILVDTDENTIIYICSHCHGEGCGCS